VAPAAGVVEDVPGPLVAAQLGGGHAVQHSVDAAVATAVEPVALRFVVTLGGGGGQRGGAI
jgi:hypothetical protein